MKAHKFTARIKFTRSAKPAENLSKDKWSAEYHGEQHEATVTFEAVGPSAALLRLHFVVQRLLLGVKTDKRIKKYGPADYTLVSLRDNWGDYDLPRGKNPDFSTVESRRQFLDQERSRTGERYTEVTVDDILQTEMPL